MELWEEYLLRHRLPVVNPNTAVLAKTFDIYIPETPSMENKLWAYFLMNHSHTFAEYSNYLEDWVNLWCDDLLGIAHYHVPTINEQQRIIFSRFPSLEYSFYRWTNKADLFTSYWNGFTQLYV